MITVPVTLRTRGVAPPFETEGFAPSLECPLAVTRFAMWDATNRKWSVCTPDDDGYMITHRPTGFTLGTGLVSTTPEAPSVVWDTRDEAYAVLLRCDPDFPAWPLAKGGSKDAATLACKAKFRWALQ